jgi:hypothetical protein
MSSSKSIILFRFHKDFDVAAERIKILRHFNPDMDIYALFGGPSEETSLASTALRGLISGFWVFPDSEPEEWKWAHSDLVLKSWHRSVGHSLTFDFLYSYEYDILTVAPLNELYPKINQDTIALAACEPFTEDIENRWSWTAKDPNRAKFLKFCQYLSEEYGIERQKKVCLGPGPLLSKKFLDAWSKTKDLDYVHDELAYPAYAEALGFECINSGLHPGFGSPDGTEYFNCHRGSVVSREMIQSQLLLANGRRAFHPVKQMIKLDELTGNSRYLR